jgi:hypothetical protein
VFFHFFSNLAIHHEVAKPTSLPIIVALRVSTQVVMMSESLVELLPTELIRWILDFLLTDRDSIREVVNYGLVCHAFRDAIHSICFRRGVVAMEWYHDNHLAASYFRR